MTDSPHRDEPGPPPVCRWCGKTLDREEASDGVRVCSDCVRLLTGAGLSDKEIYGQTDEECA